MNYAYVTLLSSTDYLAGILALNKNFKELNSDYPLYVMVTDNIIDKIQSYLKKEDIKYITVPTLSYGEETIERTKNTRLLNIASKLNVLNLKQFDKVVFIDGDSFFLKTIDELFTYPDGAMLEENGDTMGFAGLFVCCPKNHELKYYLDVLKNNFLWESDLLGSLWFPFKTNPAYRIPDKYFFNIQRTDTDKFYPINNYLYGIHFCAPEKPWRHRTANSYMNTFSAYSTVRDNIVQFYYNRYIIPLKETYPELF